jgi:hypothetical protein
MFGPSLTGLSGLRGLHGLHRLHHLHRLHRLHRSGRLADVLDFAHGIGSRGARGRHRVGRRREPSIVWLLLAGLAVLGFAKLMTVANGRERSTGEKVVLGALLVLLGVIVLSFRRSAARYR